MPCWMTWPNSVCRSFFSQEANLWFAKTSLIWRATPCSRGMRAVISTNGTLITKNMAKELRKVGLSYVGVSLDGLKEVNDRFRGKEGAFRDAMQGIRNCQEQGLKVGLRFTLNRMNVEEVPGIFDLLEEAEIPESLFLSSGVCGTGFRSCRARFGS